MMGPAARAKYTSVCSTVQSQRSVLENLPIGLMGCWSGSAIRRSEHGHQAIGSGLCRAAASTLLAGEFSTTELRRGSD
jgi:hypothetical protein